MVKFPTIPEDAKTGLILYGAAYEGANDAVFMCNAGLTCTVVDTDKAAIERMRPLYPDDWSFVCADALRYASDAVRRGARWDVVSADPFTGDAADLVLAARDPLLVPLARMLLVVGIDNKNAPYLEAHGYKIIERSASSAWAWA